MYFFQKRKSKRGRLGNQQWVIDGCERGVKIIFFCGRGISELRNFNLNYFKSSLQGSTLKQRYGYLYS
jgi:hypothetical protein